VAYGGEVAWSDIFASGDLFSFTIGANFCAATPWMALTVHVPPGRFPRQRQRVLRRLNGRETQETEPGVFVARNQEGQLAQIELDASNPSPLPSPPAVAPHS